MLGTMIELKNIVENHIATKHLRYCRKNSLVKHIMPKEFHLLITKEVKNVCIILHFNNLFLKHY